MKRLLLSFCFVVLQLPLIPLWAQNDDIEVTDSTSTDWGGGGGGGMNPGTPTGPVTSMTLSQTTLTLVGGESARLVATVNSDAANKNVLWTTADKTIAQVEDDGTVTAYKRGVITITATAKGNVSIKKTCTVTVTSDYIPPLSGVVVPWGKDASWTARYRTEDYNIDYPTDVSWTTPNYDDSSWLTLTGPLGDNDYTEHNYPWHYHWEGDYNGLNLRRDFYVYETDRTATYTFYTVHDDNMWVFLNGEFVAYFDDWSNWEIRSVQIPADKFVNGRNQLSIRIMDCIGAQYLDYTITKESTRVAGDANNDGQVNIADVTALLNYLNDNVPTHFKRANADVNSDGLLNIADVTAIINIINH